MDPDANWAEQKRIAHRLLNETYDNDEDKIRDAERLAELVDALDQWLSKGGFSPR